MAIIHVHTTQNVSLEYETASLGERIVAAIIDNIILFAWGAACFLVVYKTIGFRGEAGSVVAIVLLGLLVGIPYVFYNLICEVFFNGQSIGKKARNIKVMRLDGTAPRLGDYLLRWLLRLVDTSLPVVGGLVAIVTIAASRRGQRLGDMAAGTTVVSVRPQPAHAAPLAADLAAASSYQVVFPQVARLADHDAALVRQLLHQAQARGNYLLLNETANKVKALAGIATDLPDVPFLQTVLRDHAHLAARA